MTRKDQKECVINNVDIGWLRRRRADALYNIEVAEAANQDDPLSLLALSEKTLRPRRHDYDHARSGSIL
jgi:hypothetical protein